MIKSLDRRLEANRLLGLGGCPVQPGWSQNRWRLVRKVSVGGYSRGVPIPIGALFDHLPTVQVPGQVQFPFQVEARGLATR